MSQKLLIWQYLSLFQIYCNSVSSLFIKLKYFYKTLDAALESLFLAYHFGQFLKKFWSTLGHFGNIWILLF